MSRHRHIGNSARPQFQGDDLGPCKDNERVSVTVAVADAEQHHLRAIAGKASGMGLKATRNAGTTSLTLTGKARDIQKAFQVRLRKQSTHDGVFRTRSEDYSVPESFGGNVVAVLGLDNRPHAEPLNRVRSEPRAAPQSASSGMTPKAAAPLASPDDNSPYTAPFLAKVYGFPHGNGSGRSVGILQFGGAYQSAPMSWYAKYCNLPMPSVTFTGTQNPAWEAATIEVMMDAEIVASLIPAGRTKVYFAPNTSKGFYDCLARGIAGNHDAISISWGTVETNCPGATMLAYDLLCNSAIPRGTTICVASGDSGSIPLFPSTSPYVLSCGGTRLGLAGADKYGCETVWNSNGGASGGGPSWGFACPAYQRAIAGGRTARLTPDVSAVGDPNTGLLVRTAAKSWEVGGTSAAAPLWAALIARINGALGRRVGFVNPKLYSLPSGSMRPVTSGTNGAYVACPNGGYSMACGLGSIPSNLLELVR